ncbi:hypothetical protein OIU76_015150 [Salix suchowensis]|nr:hypothetical protein OIU76_015150 [Salix suchowensis]
MVSSFSFSLFIFMNMFFSFHLFILEFPLFFFMLGIFFFLFFMPLFFLIYFLVYYNVFFLGFLTPSFVMQIRMEVFPPKFWKIIMVLCIERESCIFLIKLLLLVMGVLDLVDQPEADTKQQTNLKTMF